MAVASYSRSTLRCILCFQEKTLFVKKLKV